MIIATNSNTIKSVIIFLLILSVFEKKYFGSNINLIIIADFKINANIIRLAFSGVEPTPSHYKYNKTFHSAADFPQENPEVAIEANGCYVMF